MGKRVMSGLADGHEHAQLPSNDLVKDLRAKACASDARVQATALDAIEKIRAEPVQQYYERDPWILRQGFAQRERAKGGELGDQALGQRR